MKLWELDKIRRYRVVEEDRKLMPVNAENMIEYDCVGEWVFSTAPEIAVTDWITWDMILETDWEEVPVNTNSKEELTKKLNEIRDTVALGRADRFTDFELLNKLDYCIHLLKD